MCYIYNELQSGNFRYNMRQKYLQFRWKSLHWLHREQTILSLNNSFKLSFLLQHTDLNIIFCYVIFFLYIIHFLNSYMYYSLRNTYGFDLFKINYRHWYMYIVYVLIVNEINDIHNITNHNQPFLLYVFVYRVLFI